MAAAQRGGGKVTGGEVDGFKLYLMGKIHTD